MPGTYVPLNWEALAVTHWYSGEGAAAASELRLALEQRPLAVEALDWTGQILVIDNGSEDDTVAIARRYTDCILSAPDTTLNFDALRNRGAI